MSESQSLRRFIPSMLSLFTRNGANGAEAKGMVHSVAGGGSNWLFDIAGANRLLPNTKYDFAADVGDGLGSSVLAGPLNFLMRTFPEAPPIVQRRKKDQWEEDVEHPLTELLLNPNPFYSGRILWMCTVLDFAWGESFLYKVRNQGREVIQLWWIPRQLVTPRWPSDGSVFISHYQYRPTGGRAIDIPVEDIVHLRFGIDPRNSRRGLSQLGSLMREVGIDDQAANFTGAILRNLGIIGLIVSPKEKGQRASAEAIKETKEYLKSMFTGDRRGEAMVHGAPIDVQLLQYQMQNFDVSPIRDVSEERVCAALGLPAAVVGFGTGLQQTKVGATMKEMRQLAWTGGIIPMQETIAAEINRALLPEFESAKRQKARFCFDTSKVRALWEDNNEKHTRVREDYKAKIIDRATALRETGRAVTTDDEGVYFTGPVPTEPRDPAITEPPKPTPTPEGEGDTA
jgi:HK97 family phage portal protein